MLRRPHQAVLFDLFDTLCRIDETEYQAAKVEQAHLLGVDADRYFDAWLAASHAAQSGALADSAARVRRAADAVGASPGEDLVRRLVCVEEGCLARATSLYPDVLPTLRALRARQGLRLGLVSNASSSAVAIFEGLGLAPYFDRTIFSFLVGALKPEPAIYLKACEELGVEPAGCLFVGDGNCRELDGAKAVGMEAVRIERPVAPGPYRKEESRLFDASVAELVEILALVRN